MQVYGSIFEIADGGHTRSVKALTRPQLNKLRVANLEIFGLLCFLLALYGQQVDRPMIHSTIALACGWRPNMENPACVDSYKGDYQAVKPNVFTVLNALIRAKSVEEQVAAKSAILADCEYAEIFCAVSALDADAPLDGPLATFDTCARQILRQQIMKVIFEGPHLAAQCIQSGFSYPMASCANSPRTRKISSHSITCTLSSITPEAIAPIFGAESGVDADDFLNSCHLGALPRNLQSCFCAVIKNMSEAGRYKLNKFITDSEYFTFEPITVQVNVAWEKTRLPEVSTCFRSMTIPPYESEEVMAAKLAYASLHGEYGKA